MALYGRQAGAVGGVTDGCVRSCRVSRHGLPSVFLTAQLDGLYFVPRRIMGEISCLQAVVGPWLVDGMERTPYDTCGWRQSAAQMAAEARQYGKEGRGDG